MFGRDEQNLWNFLFTLLFAVVLLGGTSWLWSAGRLPVGITFFDAALVALASFRLTRLFVYDKIMQFVRDWFLDTGLVEDEAGNLMLVREKPETGPRRTVVELLGCPWCFGLWITMVTTFAYFATPFLWLPILIFALAGVVSILQIGVNLIGWRAESAKQEAGGIHEH
jgi:hypothetical protein